MTTRAGFATQDDAQPADTYPHWSFIISRRQMGIHGVGGAHASAKVRGVSSVSSVGQSDTGDASTPVASTREPKRDTFRSDLSSLVKAVQGGDISGAQAALSALQSEVTPTSATYSPASTSPTATAPVVSPAQDDLQTLFTAVRGGDITGAQAALEKLQVDVRSTGPHGDHASLQGQIHGRGHGRGHGHQASNLWTAVAAAFQSQASVPAETTSPVVDLVVDPVTQPVADPVTDLIADSVADSTPTAESPASVDAETTEPLPTLA
jgi:hypothetical protein